MLCYQSPPSPFSPRVDLSFKIVQRKATLAESAKSGETGSVAAAAEAVEEGPKKYKIVVNKKGDKSTFPKKGDKVRV